MNATSGTFLKATVGESYAGREQVLWDLQSLFICWVSDMMRCLALSSIAVYTQRHQESGTFVCVEAFKWFHKLGHGVGTLHCQYYYRRS